MTQRYFGIIHEELKAYAHNSTQQDDIDRSSVAFSNHVLYFVYTRAIITNSKLHVFRDCRRLWVPHRHRLLGLVVGIAQDAEGDDGVEERQLLMGSLQHETLPRRAADVSNNAVYNAVAEGFHALRISAPEVTGSRGLKVGKRQGLDESDAVGFLHDGLGDAIALTAGSFTVIASRPCFVTTDFAGSWNQAMVISTGSCDS